MTAILPRQFPHVETGIYERIECGSNRRQRLSNSPHVVLFDRISQRCMPSCRILVSERDFPVVWSKGIPVSTIKQSRLAPAKYNWSYLWLICLVAAMGGFLFGYDWVVIGGAKAFYEPYFGITESPVRQGFAMSSALIGCIFGAILSGMLSDRFGRKRLLILAGLLFTSSAVWTACSSNLVVFNLARIWGGLGIGLASNLSPMYIAEVSPAETRGRLVSINQLTIVIGILVAQSTNWLISAPVPSVEELRRAVVESEQNQQVHARQSDLDREESLARDTTPIDAAARAAAENLISPRRPVELASDTTSSEDRESNVAVAESQIMTTYLRHSWNGTKGWRWMFAAETIPAVLFFLLMFMVPESPRWLVKNGREQLAEKVLARVGGDEYAKVEVADIHKSIASEKTTRADVKTLLAPGLPRIIWLGVFLAVLQQWCGINVIFNYAQEVFQAAGYEVGDLMFSIVITGIVNLVFTLIAIFTVDRIGRRPLMLFGTAGLATIYGVLGTAYYFQSTGIHMLVLVVTAIACYAMSLAPITWVVISEIFPNRVRGAAMSIAVLALWIGCTVLTFSFPTLNRIAGPHGVFWLYGVICVVGFRVIFKRLPETKGKSLETIERELVD
jgi:MFS family permease